MASWVIDIMRQNMPERLQQYSTTGSTVLLGETNETHQAIDLPINLEYFDMPGEFHQT
jgi:hypothetical protein